MMQGKMISPVIAIFAQTWANQIFREEDAPLRSRISSVTISCQVDEYTEWKRSRAVADWYIRDFLPAWLEAAGYVDESVSIRHLRSIIDTRETTGAWLLIAPITRTIKLAERKMNVYDDSLVRTTVKELSVPAFRSVYYGACTVPGLMPNRAGQGGISSFAEMSWVPCWEASQRAAKAAATLLEQSKLRETALRTRDSALDLVIRLHDVVEA